MEKTKYVIRAHHAMCLSYFQGKGYSPEFVENMKRLQAEYADDPLVRIVRGADLICGACPNDLNGICSDMEKVEKYDTMVMECCGLAEGDILSFAELERRVRETILDPGRREEICGDCKWSSICI